MEYQTEDVELQQILILGSCEAAALASLVDDNVQQQPQQELAPGIPVHVPYDVERHEEDKEEDVYHYEPL